jgi:hypothetical protein
MRRYLVIAHQTLNSAELLEVLRERMARGPARFHIVVPEYHGVGLVWTEGQTRAQAKRRLEEARLRFLAEGLPVEGEVGDTNPVYAATMVLRREGNAFDEVIVSTLPLGLSKWLRVDVPTRLQKATKLPVHHVVASVARV